MTAEGSDGKLEEDGGELDEGETYQQGAAWPHGGTKLVHKFLAVSGRH